MLPEPIKHYLDEKNLRLSQEIETIWKFSAQNFQTYFSFGHTRSDFVTT